MPVFKYQAMDLEAQAVQGVIQAESPRQARLLLSKQGVRVTRVTDVSHTATMPALSRVQTLWKRFRATRQRDQLLEALESLQTLLDSQVPMEVAWASLVHKHHPKARILPILYQLHEGIKSGRALSDLMLEAPEYFDTVDVALIKAGEDAGELALALGRLVARRQVANKLIATFLGALAYPLFLLTFGSLVVVFLTSSVLPNLTSMLVAGGGKVPFATQVLITGGWFLSWGLLPFLLGIAIFTVVGARRIPAFKERLMRQVLRLPVVGPALWHWQLAQFCLVLRTLLASGIHLPKALVLAGQATGTGPVADAATQLRDRILEGHDITTPDQQAQEGFPAWLWQALAIGQASGDLIPVLERSGLRFENSAIRSSTRLAAVLEPVMILGIGLLVGLVAYAALLPIMKLGNMW